MAIRYITEKKSYLDQIGHIPTICILLYSNLIKSTKLTISLNDLRLRKCYIRYLQSNILLLITWPLAAKRLVEGDFCTLRFS